MDFYILDDAQDDVLLRVTCRVVEKAWQQGLRIYVLARDEAQAARLDDTLWTFRQDAFVPHERWPGAGEAAARVLIGTGETAPIAADVLVNLGAEAPSWFAACARVAEMVGGDPEARAASRERYKMYRDAGMDLKTHEVRA